MNARYQGEDGRDALIEALQAQVIVRGDPALAEAIARVAEIRTFAQGAVLLRQDDADAQLHFILEGEVSILVNGRPLILRPAGQQIGEMGLIEPTRRSATVVATMPTTTAIIGDRAFRSLAHQFPSLWRNIARELARRLRERERDDPTRRTAPTLFIASSTESLPIAYAFREGIRLCGNAIQVVTWKDAAVFRANRTFLENLTTAVHAADVGMLVLGPDDRPDGRSNCRPTGRDGVLFELGLLTGALGRDRTFLTIPTGLDLKIPSDLLGVVPIEYSLPAGALNGPIDVTSAVANLLRVATRLGPR
jgi:CRP/FNR family cyclic AMP-dependent transcriptional regulator